MKKICNLFFIFLFFIGLSTPCIAENPKSYQAYCSLGISYGTKGDLQKAENIFEKAVKLYPDKWEAYTFLGDIKRAQKDYPIAIEYYKKAP